ncbi:VTT domain-containing protein [Polaribacter sp.]|jgi:membrane protein YqaA with SNARE-associated domain|uniref:YqaA family protein n=1 Tax=Polaribacter sp. TaxID=1920175 RepID=UPI0025E869AE|nr:VTT domain-containing protein [Polaribacter sp.]
MIKRRKRPKSNRKKFELVHKYYERTGFYSFVGKNLKNAILPILGVILLVFIFNKYVYNINDGLRHFTETFSKNSVLIVFFISESILGLIPPEIFIAWAKKTSDPVLNLFILALLSYAGGLVSYSLGKFISKLEKVRLYLEVKMAKSLKNTQKWGGVLILVGALLPLPFAIACLTAGMIKYPFKNVVFFGLFRLARYAIYGWAIFKVVH